MNKKTQVFYSWECGTSVCKPQGDSRLYMEQVDKLRVKKLAEIFKHPMVFKWKKKAKTLYHKGQQINVYENYDN
mgnify:FL=1